ncbi:MAG: hypothetical protein JWO80_5772 [Bryobacterales bacterium]|nr:hypothetical protein [Bryobacterales bacterium]
METKPVDWLISGGLQSVTLAGDTANDIYAHHGLHWAERYA